MLYQLQWETGLTNADYKHELVAQTEADTNLSNTELCNKIDQFIKETMDHFEPARPEGWRWVLVKAPSRKFFVTPKNINNADISTIL